MTVGFIVVIPARYASTRLPGKPLKDIAGKPMIEWVYRQSVASGASRVIVATDDERIAAVCRAFGALRCESGGSRGPWRWDRPLDRRRAPGRLSA